MTGIEGDLRDYRAVDARGRELGEIVSYWTDVDTSRPTFAAVRTGRFMPRMRLVPLEGARLDEEQRALRVPYLREAVLDAPVAEESVPLTNESVEAARAHYLGKATPEEMPLYGEIPHASKRVVSAGGVRLRKVVRKEIVHVPVEVLREEFVLEPVWPSDAPTDADAAGVPREPFVEGSFVLPKFQEEPIITKSTELTDVVRASRHEYKERHVVGASVRQEDVEVDREPPP
jgi:stress response protein YsnF